MIDTSRLSSFLSRDSFFLMFSAVPLAASATNTSFVSVMSSPAVNRLESFFSLGFDPSNEQGRRSYFLCGFAFSTIDPAAIEQVPFDDERFANLLNVFV